MLYLCIYICPVRHKCTGVAFLPDLVWIVSCYTVNGPVAQQEHGHCSGWLKLPNYPTCTPPPLFGFIFHPSLTVSFPLPCAVKRGQNLFQRARLYSNPARVSLSSCSAGIVGRFQTRSFNSQNSPPATGSPVWNIIEAGCLTAPCTTLTFLLNMIDTCVASSASSCGRKNCEVSGHRETEWVTRG
ncbi:hypothetical protein BDW72DRAFT_127944 [Aspergillus terricola var. indicus]